jgi:hypothetical protein
MPQCISTPPVFRKVAAEQWAACHLHDIQDPAPTANVEKAA